MSASTLKTTTRTMKAVIWSGKPYSMTVQDIPRPTVQAPTDVLVRVTMAAICGTDLHTYHGLFGGSDVPYPMGHEAIGIVVEAGSEVQNFKRGDRVVVPAGNFNPTPDSPLVYGYGVGNLVPPTGEEGGCQAEFVCVPAADRNLIAVPAGGDKELDYLLLSDIFPTAWESISFTGFQAGDTVAVYGAGPVGLLAAYSALLRGASKVYSIDHVEARLARAESIGAIPINLAKGDPADQILKLEPNGVRRTTDCVGFECVNSKLEPEEGFIINNMIKLVAANGGIAITGVYWGLPASRGEPNASVKRGEVTINVAAWWLKNVSIGGGPVNLNPQEPALRDLITAGRATPSFVFDKIVDIEDAPKAYQLFSDQKVQKVAIRF